MIVDTQREKYQAVEEPNYLVCDRGWRSWAFTLDHKRIGVMYLAGILTGDDFFAVSTPGRSVSS